MLVRYDVQIRPAGWRVVDRQTGTAASADCVVVEHWMKWRAGEVADLLASVKDYL